MLSNACKKQFGSHLIVGLSGPTLDAVDRAILSEFQPAGILLLGKNFLHGSSYNVWHGALSALLSEVYALTKRAKMLITLDHEGGRVVRTPLPITNFPAPILYKERSAEAAHATALELLSLGVNVSWAPCADIHSNPKNPIIGSRAFGTTPEDVSKFAVPYMLELNKAGVLPCAKHFPGHGDTTSDSHLELPRLKLSEKELFTRELLPFQALINAGVPMIMTAHILFPSIDANFPATMSKKILADILRKQMKFGGVIISDDLDMRAVSNYFDDESALSNAFEAGCDMFIIARHLDSGTERINTVAGHFGSMLSKGFKPETARIDKLLSLASRPVPYALSKSVLKKNYELALEIAGAVN
jgi:beta-N-acetylhexosaminidase